MQDRGESDGVVAPKIIATRGDGIYLADLGNGQGQIAKTQTGEIFPPKHIDALISRGYWEPTHDVDVAECWR
jgi:hypothetical protein